jgi:hypothetical protein
MKHKQAFNLLAILFLITSCALPPADTSGLPDHFRETIPPKLKGGLTLVELKDRGSDCDPWRYVDYYGNTSKEPIKSEKVTVKAGYRAMYAYPSTHYFSNTKIEESASGSYESDKAIVIDALKHEYDRKRELIVTYLKDNQQIVDKMEPLRAKGKEYVEYEEKEYRGIEYVSYVENVIGLTGNTISQIHIFVPKRQIIITAYLLRQDKAKFDSIEEFLSLRQDFIESYIDYISSSSDN